MGDKKGNGRLFKPGNTAGVGFGRPKSSGKQMIKDLVWEKLNRIVELLFDTPEKDLEAILKANKETMLLSRAERLYLEKSTDLSVIADLLDRIIGKILVSENQSERDPIIERLYRLGPGGVKKDIDELIEARNIINAEYRELEAPKEINDTEKTD